MKQQGGKPEIKRERKTETFHFNEQEFRNYGSRTGAFIKRANPDNRGDGYARWSDYITEDSNDMYIPREASSSFSSIKREAVGLQDSDDHAKLPDASSSVLLARDKKQGEVRENSKQAQLQEKSVQKEEGEKEMHSVQKAQKAQKEVLISNESAPLSAEPKVPFFLPNISSIKERKSMGGRRSEQFLLDLLKSEKTRREEEREKKEMEREAEQRKAKQQKEIQKRRNKEVQKMDVIEPVDKRKSNRVDQQQLAKQSRNHNVQKYRTQQLKTISQKVEEDKSTKSKRVTINDKGKIKLPTDSFSAEFQYILPPSLRKGEESTYHKRARQIIEEKEENQEKIEEKNEEPMDIIEQPNQIKNNNRQLLPQPQVKGLKIKKTIRVTDNPDKIPSPPPKKIQKKQEERAKKNGPKSIPKQTKSQSRQKARQNKSSKPKAISKNKKGQSSRGSSENKVRQKKARSQNVREVELNRKKLRKGGENIIVERFISDNISSNSRPIRQRSQPLKFWEGQKIHLNLQGQPVTKYNLSNEQFLQMVGFSKTEKIDGKVTLLASRYVKARITLHPRRYLYSSGIDYDLMKRFIPASDYYNQLRIQCAQGSKEVKRGIKVVVNDFEQKNLQNGITIEKDQTFSLKNEHQSRQLDVVLTLMKASHQSV